MATGTRVTGLRETIRNLERLGVNVQDLKEAFLDIANDVVQEAGALVRRKTGALAATIRPAKSKNKAVVRAGNGTRVPYAGIINYNRPGDEFLTRPANENPEQKIAKIEHNLDALIRRYSL